MHVIRISCRLCLAVLASLWLVACANLGSATGADVRRAEIALERGDYPRAVEQLRVTAQASGDPRISERAARVAFEHSQFRALAVIAREWLARDAHQELAHRFLAVALLELDERAAAEVELGVLVQSAYPSPAAAFEGLGESLADLHNAVGVAAAMTNLAKGYPTVAQAPLAVASLRLAAGQASAAREAAERALVLNPDSRDARSLIARAQVFAGDCDGGLAAQDALRREGALADSLVYAWLLVECGRGREAEPYFLDLVHQPTLRAEALEGLGGLELEAGRLDAALARYNELLATHSHPERARYGLARVADQRQDWVLAQQRYQQVTEGPRLVTAQLRSYRLLLDLGRAEEAARVLDAVVAGAPDRQVELTAGRAQVLANVSRFADALSLLDRAERSYPDRTELVYARAVVLEQSGRLVQAVRVLEALQRRRPLDPSAANALGFTLADHSQRLPEAERLIRSALQQLPDSAAIKDSLGWVLYRQGQAQAALEWLTAAYHLDQDAEIARHLGEVRWALGEHAQAIRLWQDAARRAPEDTALQRLLQEHTTP